MQGRPKLNKREELRQLREDLRKCQATADRLELNMASAYIAHAAEHVEIVMEASATAPRLRTVQGGKSDS